MKRIMLVWLFVVLAVTCQAEDQRSLNITLSIDYMNKYVGFDNGAVFYGKPMLQTDLRLDHRSGIHADIWWGTGFDSNLRGSAFDDEVDWNTGYTHKFRVGSKQIYTDIGLGYWDIMPTFSTRNDVLRPYVEVGSPVRICKDLELVPYVNWHGFFLPFKTTFEEGNFFSVGTKYTINLPCKGWSVTGLTSFGYDDGGFGFKTGFVWKNYSNIEWNINPWLTWKVFEYQVYVPFPDDRSVQQVFGTGVTFCF